MTGPTRSKLLTLPQLEGAAREVAQVARRSGVPIAAAGGYAMQAYGSTRMTTDLDVVAPRMPSPLTKIKRLSFGGYATKSASGVVVDVIVRDDEFAKLYRDAARRAVRIEGLPIRVILKGHLIAMKMVAGRPKDDLDLNFLLPRMSKEEIKEARKIVVQHLGDFAGREFDTQVAEAEWQRTKERRDLRRRRR